MTPSTTITNREEGREKDGGREEEGGRETGRDSETKERVSERAMAVVGDISISYFYSRFRTQLAFNRECGIPFRTAEFRDDLSVFFYLQVTAKKKKVWR